MEFLLSQIFLSSSGLFRSLLSQPASDFKSGDFELQKMVGLLFEKSNYQQQKAGISSSTFNESFCWC